MARHLLPSAGRAFITIALGAAIMYDWTVSAIGPFEMSEYAGLGAIYGALAVTALFRAAERSGRWVAVGQET